MTQNQYETLVQCPDCGNTQPFNGTLKPRAHTRCSDCKKDFYVMSNLMPTDYNDNADKQLGLFETDNSTDSEGNVYIGDADKMPTLEKDITSMKQYGTITSLIIALNYAINTIKNKSEVLARKEDSTWYAHYKSWTRLREYFQSLEDEKG